MKSFLLDSNALVYWLHPNSPKNAEVSTFLQTVFECDYSVFILSSCLNEVYYALHVHYMDEKTARSCIATAAEVFELVDLTDGLITSALASDEPDYEDGLVRAAAEALEVDAIITYDKMAFRHSHIPKQTALEALATLSNEK